MSSDCARVEGLLAASMYESLPTRERELLDTHLDECVVCRETIRGFERLVKSIPVEHAKLETDLLPQIRVRLRDEKPGRSSRLRKVAVYAAAASIAFATLAGSYTAFWSDSPSSNQLMAFTMPSQLDRTFSQVDKLMDARFHSRAYVVLEAGVKRYPNDSRAPEALQLAADLAFEELHWYPQAHESLRALRDTYTTQFERQRENRIQLEMLEEAILRDDNYLALQMLDAARNNVDFETYEQVLSANPGTYIAARALDEMTAALTEEGDVVSALETLAESCTHPLAVAQVKIRLARTLDESGGPQERVRSLYEEAASSDSVALASTARDALRELDTAR